VLGRGSWLEQRDDTRAPRVSEERQGGGTDLGLVPGWAMGRFGFWAEISPRGHLFFFDFFSPFSFLISVLFCIFCKNASNQFKTLSKFL
jgi:hypothetical protein